MPDYKNDIEKYLKGELTPAQMNALEKKALSDPFLADALEGIQSLQPHGLEADLRHLEGALNKRVSGQKNVVWIWASRIAAGLIIIALSTYVVVLLSNRKDSNNLALNKPVESTPRADGDNSNVQRQDSITQNENLLSTPAPKTEDLKEANEKLELRDQSSSQSAIQKPAATEVAEEDLPPAPSNEDSEQDIKSQDPVNPIVPEEKVARLEAKKEAPAPSDASRESRKKDSDDLDADVAKQKSIAGASDRRQAYNDKSHRSVIRGRVTFSDDGTGLPGVNVIIKGTNEGTVTDAEGNYQIPVDDPETTLVFSFIGFSSKEEVAKSDELNVQLDADISELSEVVVVGYGSTRAPSSLPFDSPVMELATPEGGRKVFKQYLEQNLKYPEEAIKNQVEGKVTVQFTIETSGQMSDFRVIRGIGFGCDEEVIRLIKQGPKWSPSKKDEEPVRDKVKVRMRFALPKK